MNIKLAYALFGAFFLASQNMFAEENQFSEADADTIEEANLFATDYSYSPYLQLGGARFFNIHTANWAVGGDIFVPIWQLPAQLVYTHIRFYDRTGKPFEGNIHLGYRHLMPEKDHLYGIYGAFDRRRTEFGNYFNQLTIGVEGWFHQVFIGGNFYQPVGGTTSYIGITKEALHADRIYNNLWITRSRMYEKAMGGGDAEVGYELINGLVGYVGGYYFSAKDTATICGPKARITYDWSLNNGKRILGVFDKIGLEGGVQRDNPRGTTYYLGANVRIGLLPNRENNLQGVARHMVDLVRRDVDIVSSTSVEDSREEFKDENGNPIKLYPLSDSQSQAIDSGDFNNVMLAEGKVLLPGDIEIVSPETGNVLKVVFDSSEVVGDSNNEELNNTLERYKQLSNSRVAQSGDQGENGGARLMAATPQQNIQKVQAPKLYMVSLASGSPVVPTLDSHQVQRINNIDQGVTNVMTPAPKTPKVLSSSSEKTVAGGDLNTGTMSSGNTHTSTTSDAVSSSSAPNTNSNNVVTDENAGVFGKLKYLANGVGNFVGTVLEATSFKLPKAKDGVVLTEPEKMV